MACLFLAAHLLFVPSRAATSDSPPDAPVNASAVEVAASSAAPPATSVGYPFRVERVARVSAQELYAINDGFAPVNLIIDLTKAKNTGFAPNVIGANTSHLIPAKTRKLITMAVPLKRGRPMEFAYTSKYSFGDNLAEVEHHHVYRLPLPNGARAVIRTFGGLPFTTNFATTSHAVELVAPQGTPVVAARDGQVFAVHHHATNEASSPSPIGDYVLVLHGDGSWAVYGWLLSSALRVSEGQMIKAGDEIGAIGSNPTSADTFLFFAAVRNLAGTKVGAVPLVFASASIPEIDPRTYTGPVSPDLAPKYPAAFASDPWNPPERLLPTPQVISDYGDEGLSPAQRQSLYRKRIVEHANAGRETVNDSRPMVIAIGAAIVLSIVGVSVSLLGAGKSTASGGARSWLWGLIHGSAPSGMMSVDLPHLTEPEPSGERIEPMLDPNESPFPTGAAPETTGAAAADPQEAGPALPSQRLHDPATLELIRHVHQATPVGLISNHLVPAANLVPTAAPGDILDFVFVRATDATVVLVMLTADRSTQLVHNVTVAGLACVQLPNTPSADQVKQTIQAAIASN